MRSDDSGGGAGGGEDRGAAGGVMLLVVMPSQKVVISQWTRILTIQMRGLRLQLHITSDFSNLTRV